MNIYIPGAESPLFGSPIHVTVFPCNAFCACMLGEMAKCHLLHFQPSAPFFSKILGGNRLRVSTLDNFHTRCPTLHVSPVQLTSILFSNSLIQLTENNRLVLLIFPVKMQSSHWIAEHFYQDFLVQIIFIFNSKLHM